MTEGMLDVVRKQIKDICERMYPGYWFEVYPYRSFLNTLMLYVNLHPYLLDSTDLASCRVELIAWDRGNVEVAFDLLSYHDFRDQIIKQLNKAIDRVVKHHCNSADGFECQGEEFRVPDKGKTKT
ncbi:hypothetical protein LCGC14_2321830 [marine sediment metagenome]|uniref:Uncharacterized protein n=1 Tax=marine sediment metagenome TaxID=412755 RepID=A0A0F9D555_9ZZZZ